MSTEGHQETHVMKNEWILGIKLSPPITYQVEISKPNPNPYQVEILNIC